VSAHAARIVELQQAFTDAMTRLLARLDGASAAELVQTPAGGGWSPAQVAWHVGAINNAFAGLIDGSIPQAKEPGAEFVETPWRDLAARVPDKLEAPQRFHPPADVSAADAVQLLRASQPRLVDALAGLSETRAAHTVKSVVGTPINLYQVGNWAVSHVARHNAQVKRALQR
jgi:hypothetical protein